MLVDSFHFSLFPNLCRECSGSDCSCGHPGVAHLGCSDSPCSGTVLPLRLSPAADHQKSSSPSPKISLAKEKREVHETIAEGNRTHYSCLIEDRGGGGMDHECPSAF